MINMFYLFKLLNFGHYNETAVEFGDQKVSKGKLINDVEQIAKGLKHLGVEAGEKIAISADNSYRGIVVNFAANALGIKTVFLNPADNQENLIEDLKTHKVVVLFVSEKNEQFARKIIRSVDSLDRVVEIGPSKNEDEDSIYNYNHEYIPYRTLFRVGNYYTKSISRQMRKHAFDHDDIVFLQTSGSSTGRPKSLPFSNANIFAALMQCSKSSGIKVRDKIYKRCLCILPYRLPYGWTMIFMNLIGGQTVVLADGTSPKDTGNFYKAKVQAIYGTPSILRGIMDNSPKSADFSDLRIFYSGGSGLPEIWYEEGITFFKNHGAKNPQICNDYGIGEGLCMGTDGKDLPHIPGTVGKFYIGPDWRLLDDDLFDDYHAVEEVEPGRVGEVFVYAKSLCNGYFNDPVGTKASFVELDGSHKKYLRTGDYASVDPDTGYVVLEGRKKRFYLPLGANDKVNCETVEQVIMSSGFVKCCAVVPMSDKKKVNIGVAHVVLKKDTKENRTKLTKFMKSKLLDYQMPDKFIYKDKLPLMNSGKINYTLLSKE